MSADLDLVALKKKAESPGYPQADNPEQELTPREIPITIRYTSPESGSPMEATITSQIMSATDRAVVARMVAQMAGGAPWDALPPIQRGRFHALAVCTVQMRGPPDWLLKWIAEDNILLDAVYAECEKHESFFFRASLRTSETSKGQAGLVVTSTLVAPDEPVSS